jgi:hypothetical protein
MDTTMHRQRPPGPVSMHKQLGIANSVDQMLQMLKAPSDPVLTVLAKVGADVANAGGPL